MTTNNSGELGLREVTVDELAAVDGGWWTGIFARAIREYAISLWGWTAEEASRHADGMTPEEGA